MANNTDLGNPSENDDNVDFVLEPNKATTCQNCESEHDIDFEFCPHCGQQANDKLTVGVLFYNTIANYFSFDARFFKSFIPLMFKPGKLAKQFIQGKRLLYLHPAQMYLFISVLFFFLYSFKVREASQRIDKALQEVDMTSKGIDSMKNAVAIDSVVLDNIKKNQELTNFKNQDLVALDSIITSSKEQSDSSNNGMNFGLYQEKVDSLIAAGAPDKDIYTEIGLNENSGFLTRKLYTQMLKLYKTKNGGSLLQSFYDTIPLALFFLLPIFAFLLKLMFYRKGSFAHHLVFSFYFFSFLFTVFSFIIGINYLWEIADWIDTIVVLLTFFYLFIAIRHFYGQGWFISFFKASVTTFIYLLFVAPLAFVIILGIAFMFY